MIQGKIRDWSLEPKDIKINGCSCWYFDLWRFPVKYGTGIVPHLFLYEKFCFVHYHLIVLFQCSVYLLFCLPWCLIRSRWTEVLSLPRHHVAQRYLHTSWELRHTLIFYLTLFRYTILVQKNVLIIVILWQFKWQ